MSDTLKPRAILLAFALALISPPAFAVGAEVDGESSILVKAIQAAVKEARRCGVDVDQVDVSAALKDGLYRVEFVERRKRGGGATIVIDRSSMKVKEAACVQ
ncbi:hypothetical protein [Stenotrophomonas sp.]|uniref:hypothetical protein n=1 Tax=Stenotrophomonas sp. TaxID=69392 RepID=UPI00289DA396|nr:hypothetical protein [Stenotrophomonas sp.]